MTSFSCDEADTAVCEGNLDEAIYLYTKAMENCNINQKTILYLNRAFAYNLNATTDGLRFVIVYGL